LTFGIDGLAALCRKELEEDPFSGTLFVFRNRRGTALKLLTYDGLGYYLVTRRFSQGHIRWWPQTQDELLHPLQAQQLSVLLYNGLPDQAQFAPVWRKLPPADSQAASVSLPSSSL
jgi:transposase